MRVNLEAQGLWDVRLALAAVLRAIPTEMLGRMARKKSAQEAWEAIKTVRVGDARAKEANAQQLRRELAAIAFQPGELVDDFSLRLDTLANKLRVMGDDIEEYEVVKKLLQVAPNHLA